MNSEAAKTEVKRDSRDAARAGFTLIEVMLVVIILGILATVVVVNFVGKSGEAKDSIARTSIQNICTAVEMYEMQVGHLPTAMSDLTASIGDTPPPLKNGIPKDPWGTDFQYTKKSETSYEVRSAGKDQQMGNDNDLTN